MITLTGFDVNSFTFCLVCLPLFWIKFKILIMGVNCKKWELRKVKSNPSPRWLEIALAWSHAHGSLMNMQLSFGMTISPVLNNLQFARTRAIRVLMGMNAQKSACLTLTLIFIIVLWHVLILSILSSNLTQICCTSTSTSNHHHSSHGVLLLLHLSLLLL